MPLDSQLIAGALAHGLSPGAIATWDPRLARTPRVMVPVQLDVLMVREEGGTWAQTAMTVPDPGSEPSAPTLLPDPFSERAPRPTGALPALGAAGRAHRRQRHRTRRRRVLPADPRPLAGSPAVHAATRCAPGASPPGYSNPAAQQPVVTPLDSWTEPEDPERTTTPGEQPLTALGSRGRRLVRVLRQRREPARRSTTISARARRNRRRPAGLPGLRLAQPAHRRPDRRGPVLAGRVRGPAGRAGLGDQPGRHRERVQLRRTPG